MPTRRSFVSKSSLIALSPLVPAFLKRTAAAATPATDDRLLVILQLDGGNDGLNTVVPYNDPGYAKNRKRLRLPNSELLKINDEVGLHPSLRAARELFDDGQLSIVPAVGYPNPDRSHFRSMSIWQSARFDDREHDGYGWIGRALDSTHVGGDADAVYVGQETLPVALRGRRSVASSMVHTGSLAGVTLSSPIKPQSILAAAKPGDDLTSFVERTVLDAYTTADQLAKSRRPSVSRSSYPPTDLAMRLELISNLIKSNLSTRVYYASLPGFDTHAVQLPAHARLLKEFAGAVKAFLDDLSEAGLADRVCVMAFSEFGRRVKENDSLGTDHGTAGPVFVAGHRIKPGIQGRNPSLENLDHGDLRVKADFRDVYAALLEQWLGVDSDAALGGARQDVPVLF